MATFWHPGIESSSSFLYLHRDITVRDIYEVKAYSDKSVKGRDKKNKKDSGIIR